MATNATNVSKGEETREAIMKLMSKVGPMQLSDIHNRVGKKRGVEQATIGYHMRMLRDEGKVTYEGQQWHPLKTPLKANGERRKSPKRVVRETAKQDARNDVAAALAEQPTPDTLKNLPGLIGDGVPIGDRAKLVLDEYARNVGAARTIDIVVRGECQIMFGGIQLNIRGTA